MKPEIHQGFEVHPDCQCLSEGADGTSNHSEGLVLIEIAQGISAGRRTRTCANHLQNYIVDGIWKTLVSLESGQFIRLILIQHFGDEFVEGKSTAEAVRLLCHACVSTESKAAAMGACAQVQAPCMCGSLDKP